MNGWRGNVQTQVVVNRFILLSLVLALLALAGSAAPEAGTSSVLIPATGAGGRISVWSTGSIDGSGDGWADGKPGRCQFRVEWIDVDDEFHVAACAWTVDVPEGKFVLGAEKDGEQLTLTLSKLGEEAPLLRSKPFDIEQGQPVDGHQQH
jgi:hypothetical protein